MMSSNATERIPIQPGTAIYKIPSQSSTPSSSKALSWVKGSNAKFHYICHAFVSEEIDTAAEEETQSMLKEHEAGHPSTASSSSSSVGKSSTSSSSCGKDGCKEPEATCVRHGHAQNKAAMLQKRAEMMERLIKGKSAGSSKKSTKETPAAAAKEGNQKWKEKMAGNEAASKPSGAIIKKLIRDTKADNMDEPFELRIGLGFTVPALEKCVKTIKVGERAKFLCMPEECEGYSQLETVLRQEAQNRELIKQGLPPMRTGGCCAHFATSAAATGGKDLLLCATCPLEFDIHLLSVASPDTFQREVWEMNAKEKSEEAPKRKEEGTRLYRAGDVEGACKEYERALQLLESLSMSPAVTDPLRDRKLEVENKHRERRKKIEERKRLQRIGKPIPPELLDVEAESEAADLPDNSPASVSADDDVNPDEVLSLLKVTRLNYAQCKLKLGEFPACIMLCTDVLKTDLQNLKALFKRAQAHMRGGRDLDLAERDLKSFKEALLAQGIVETSSSTEWNELKREEKELERRMRVVREKEKAMFGKMFQ